MRDSFVINKMQRREALNDHNAGVLKRGLTLNMTRMDAVEEVLMGGRFALLRAVFMQMVSPDWLRRRVNAVHQSHYDQYEAAEAALREKKKSEISVPKKEILTVHG